MACGFYLHLYRKQFRPAFGKLDVLCSIFRVVPILALTATATKAKQKKDHKFHWPSASNRS